MKKKTTEQVTTNFKLKHGDKYDYSLVEYNGNKHIDKNIIQGNK